MKNFFKGINAVLQNGGRGLVLSSLDEERGDKVILSGKEIVWQNEGCRLKKEELENQRLQELMQCEQSQVVELDGVRWLLEILKPEARLIICGAGHVALSCLRMAKLLGMNVTVLEDREEYAKQAEEAGADLVVCKPFREAIRELENTDNCKYLVMTRAHKMDQDCLEEIFRKPYSYVGMLGSPKKIAALRNNLVQAGIEEAHFEKLHSPVGLDIGAKTPAEIGVSVMAELIQLQNSGKEEASSYSREMLGRQALHPAAGILCTLVDNGGGSPRNPGTKMLVYSSDDRIGTIGGGVLEGTAIREAVKMLEEGMERKIIHSGVDGNDSGMACCRNAEVLLERVE